MVFADDLARFAQRSPVARVGPIVERLRRPTRVATRGRSGVGVRTVASALAARGMAVTPGGHGDVVVLVIAETLKPEERASLVVDPATLIVLNKADLTASGPGRTMAGPMSEANRRAATLEADTGVPTFAMAGLLAAGADRPLDDELVTALRAMVDTPPELSSVDGFTSGAHPVARELRSRLLDRFDRFGVAHAVVALARGADPAVLPQLWRGLSQVDAVVAGVRSGVAAFRYRELRRAVAELRVLAIRSGDDDLAGWLCGEASVMAAMAAAVEVVQAAGLRVDGGHAREAHMRRAVQWRRYGRGPINPLHRECAADIVRGSLWLLADTAPR